MRAALYASCVLLCSCASAVSPVKNYGYVFHETTGITSAILVDGQEVKIKFISESDKTALDTLTSLNWTVLYPNSDGDHIFVKGHLNEITQMTPDLPNMAASEPFKEFKLVSWYITTPFKRITYTEEFLPESYEVELSHTLLPTDFTNKEVINGVSLSDFQIESP